MSAEVFSLAMNEISDRYIEEALTYQAPAKHLRAKPLLRMVLAACLALIMALGTAMSVSAEFREAVFGWIKEQYETWTHYEYREEEETGKPDADSETFVRHYLTEVPPGYTEIVNDIDTEIGQQLIVYQNEENGNMCFVAARSGGDAYVEAEGYTIQPVEVAGVTGELYLADDPAKDNCIVWLKEEMFFYISGYFTPEELVYYAECLQPVPVQEKKAPNYQLGYIPKGYTFLTENHSPHDHAVIYSNEAGHTLSFCYIWDPDGAEAFVKNSDTQVTTTIHGAEADLMLSSDLSKESSSIVWAEDEILFSLSAFLPEDELIALAESVEEVPLLEMEEET